MNEVLQDVMSSLILTSQPFGYIQSLGIGLLLSVSNLLNLHDPLLRHERKTPPNALPNHYGLVTLEVHPEYDLETRLKLGPDEQVRVHGFPVFPAHRRTKISGGRAI